MAVIYTNRAGDITKVLRGDGSGTAGPDPVVTEEVVEAEPEPEKPAKPWSRRRRK
jgi:hypothetical protein